MSMLFTILWLTDFVMFLIAVENTLTHGVGGMVLFASEYGILMASVSNTIAKYLLSAYDLRRAGQRGGENAPPWENKSMWVFYIELTTDFLKLTTYLAFFSVIITFYGLPLNIIRDVYITARSLYTRLHDLHRYQIATRNMDQRYPNATEEELGATSDRTCIICREEMVTPAQPADGQQAPAPQSDGPNMTPKKLPCGHIFHFHCLRSWLERQQSCPTCRRSVLDNTNVPAQAPAGQAAARQGAQQPPQNPFAGVGAQNLNARPRNENENYIGLLGRMLGNQNPQAAAARRPLGAPPQGNLGVPNVTNDAAGRVVIQYNINYQLPAGQGGPNQGTQAPVQGPPELQPVQPFNGFEGPGNVWQPWPANNPGPNPTAAEQAPMSPATRPSEDPTSPQASPSSPSGSDHSSDQASTATVSSTNPRDEAARAALRRFNTSTSRLNDGVGPDEGGSVRPAPTEDAPGQHQQPFDVPGLIPLYDFNFDDNSRPAIEQTSAPRASIPTHHSSSMSTIHSNGPSAPSRVPVPAEQFPGNQTSFGVGNSLPLPLAPLPPTLSDEQLSALDKSTREAIDERLRILERVSTSVHHNIEDLLRMRSVLPAAPITSTAAAHNSSGVHASGSNPVEPTDQISHETNEGRSPQPSGAGVQGVAA
ncbi:E3 ubiquitin-protein ligase hrd1 [Marasmius crinis-equi]|uniref:RING-type E3 ubiquitin transferase n=1 Tax=Marasmius crinis-equi TaxID=585013 RepID=A0ABR3G1W5_9AGAR